MHIFTDSVSGSDKKHILCQHYINDDYFLNAERDEIKIHTDPRLVLPTTEGGKPITRAVLHSWLRRILPKLKPEEQIVLTAVCIRNKGFFKRNGVYARGDLYTPNGRLAFDKINPLKTIIQEEIRERNSRFTARLRAKTNTAELQKKCVELASSKASVENLLIGALNERIGDLTSSKETATMIFGCLTGFASGAVPGISLGALGYTLVLGSTAGFALGATPIGWLIGGAILCGIIGAVAFYTYNYFSKKHDDKSHKTIYTKNKNNEQLALINAELTAQRNEFAFLISAELAAVRSDLAAIKECLNMPVQNPDAQRTARHSLRRNVSGSNIASLTNSQFTTFQPAGSANADSNNPATTFRRRASRKN